MYASSRMLFVIISRYMFYQHILFHLLHLRFFTAHVSKKDLCCLMSLIILIFFRDFFSMFQFTIFLFILFLSKKVHFYDCLLLLKFSFLTILLGGCHMTLIYTWISFLQKLGWLRFIQFYGILIWRCQHVWEIEIEIYWLWCAI